MSSNQRAMYRRFLVKSGHRTSVLGWNKVELRISMGFETSIRLNLPPTIGYNWPRGFRDILLGICNNNRNQIKVLIVIIEIITIKSGQSTLEVIV